MWESGCKLPRNFPKYPVDWGWSETTSGEFGGNKLGRFDNLRFVVVVLLSRFPSAETISVIDYISMMGCFVFQHIFKSQQMRKFYTMILTEVIDVPPEQFTQVCSLKWFKRNNHRLVAVHDASAFSYRSPTSKNGPWSKSQITIGFSLRMQHILEHRFLSFRYAFETLVFALNPSCGAQVAI